MAYHILILKKFAGRPRCGLVEKEQIKTNKRNIAVKDITMLYTSTQPLPPGNKPVLHSVEFLEKVYSNLFE